jgi:aryl-alcohol dehydrogenase-like predicted oxidoreductase
LAWVLRHEHVVAIPGTRSEARLAENAAAAALVLTPPELVQLEEVFPLRAAAGERYPEQAMRTING